MPENLTDSNEERRDRGRLARPWNASPRRFAAAVMGCYLLACVPMLAVHGGNPAIFVMAGARWVDRTQTTPPLPVRANSDGYDGQFYYRLAQHPFAVATRIGGIAFDHPAKRMERIFFPLLGWMLSFGQVSATAFALFALNLFGIGAIAWLACALTSRLGLASFVPVAIVLWPGFIVALMRDTTEIVSTALMLAALLAITRGWLIAYAGLAACAALTRETTLPLFLGLLLTSVSGIERDRRPWSDWRRMAACIMPILSFLVWRQIVSARLHEAPQANGMAQDLSWPLLGFARMLIDRATSLRHWSHTPATKLVLRLIVLLSAPAIVAFCVLVASRIGRAVRMASMMGIAAGWVLTAVLMSLLTAHGPWIDPIAYFRAFTECYVIGCLVLGATEFNFGTRSVALLAGFEAMLAWMTATAQLR